MRMLAPSINGPIATFPIEDISGYRDVDISFKDRETADSYGAHILATLFGIKQITETRLLIDGDQCSIDIHLQGQKWTDPSRNGKRFVDIIGQGLEKRFIDEQNPLMGVEFATYFQADFLRSVGSFLEEISDKPFHPNSKGTINNHNGGIEPVAHDPHSKSLVLKFKGACATTECAIKRGEGARTATENFVISHLCREYPGAFMPQKIEFIS